MEKTSERDALASVRSSANSTDFETAKVTVAPPTLQLKSEHKAEEGQEKEMQTENTPFQFAAEDISPPPVMTSNNSASPFQLQQKQSTPEGENTELVTESQAFQLAAEGTDPPEDGSASGLAGSKQNNTGLPTQLKTGVEGLSGFSLDDVNVHYNSDKPAQLKAHAYAQGSDIHLGPGQEQHLPHEAWHVVQQKQGRVQPSTQLKAFNINDDAGLEQEADVMGAKAMQMKTNNLPENANLNFTNTKASNSTLQQIIQPKLKGSVEAISATGGAPSKKSKGKATLSKVKGVLSRNNDDVATGSGKYAQIFSDLSVYESLEEKYFRKGNLSADKKGVLLSKLNTLIKYVRAWLAQNEAEAKQDPQEVKKSLLGHSSVEELQGSETSGQKRFHALQMLLVRLKHEEMEIATDQFNTTKIWSDNTLNEEATTDNAFGGAVNRLDKVVHEGEDKEGVFIWDQSYDGSGTAGKDLGIPDVDPMAGSRSVAMYQLAKLLDFDMNVIAKTEFATHKSNTKGEDENLDEAITKFGIRMEIADGKEAAETPISFTDADKKEGETSLEDPVLQKGLNALQLIDAIAGQLDRHWHNYYIATDQDGKVTGVVGIDLDMAFAMNHNTVDPVPVDTKGKAVTSANFVGMPLLVDESFAQKIIQLDTEQLERVLSIYLSKEEVTSTMIRFNLVKDSCIDLQGTDNIVTDWNADTAKKQQDSSSSYLGKMQDGKIVHEFGGTAKSTLDALYNDSPVGQDKGTQALIHGALDIVINAMKERQLTLDQSNLLIETLKQKFQGSTGIQEGILALNRIVDAGRQRAEALTQEKNAQNEAKKLELHPIDQQKGARIDEVGEALKAEDPQYMALDVEYQAIQEKYKLIIEPLYEQINLANEGDPVLKEGLRTQISAWIPWMIDLLLKSPIESWDDISPIRNDLTIGKQAPRKALPAEPKKALPNKPRKALPAIPEFK